MASRGSGARARGHRFEVEVAKTLMHSFGVPIAPTRREMRGVGGDLCTKVNGVWVPWVLHRGRSWSIECKSQDVQRWEDWLAQAQSQRDIECPGATAAVIIDRKHYPITESYVLIEDERDHWTIRTLGNWMTR
jgi:hypothetical protein